MAEVKKNYDFLREITKGNKNNAIHQNRSAKELVRMNDKFYGIINVMDDVRLEERLFRILKKVADRLKVPADRESLDPDIERLKVNPELWMPFDQSFEFDNSINECLSVFVQNRGKRGDLNSKIQAVESMNRVLENPKYRITQMDDSFISIKAVERMRTVFGLGDSNTEEASKCVLGGYWRPFQKRWIQDKSRQKIVEKSRRTGYTFGSAFEWNIDALLEDGDSSMWISRSEKLAKQFSKKYLMLWTRVINDVVERDFISSRFVNANEVNYPNGHTIIMLSSSVDAVAGFGGRVGMDEFALHPNQAELYDVASPAIMYGDRLQVISTHRGRGQFYDFIMDAKQDGSVWSYHKCDIKEAIADGIVQVVNNLRIRKGLEPVTDQQFYNEIREGARSDNSFMQEYMCKPSDESNAVLSYDLIRSCVVPASKIINKDGEGRQYFGYDFGLTVNPSCMMRIEEKKGKEESKLSIRKYSFVKDKRFVNQKNLAMRMMDKCHRGAMDAGAQASQMAQELEEHYKDRFEGLMLTGSRTRAEMANLVWRMFDEGRIEVPDDDTVIEHLFAIKKEESDGKQTRIYSEGTSNKDDHADFFWALALALTAHGGYTANETIIRRLPRGLRKSDDVFASNFY
jgi:phage FluMu gp28-like protein